MNLDGRESSPVHPNRILVVEDDFDIRQVLSVYLKHSGFEVSSASNGKEAIALILSEKPELVVLDLMMRPVNGWEVLKWLHAQRLTPTLPVLLMTAISHLDEQIRGFEEGAIDYIIKPTQPDMIVERIRALLRLSVEQRALLRRRRIDEQRAVLERVHGQLDEFV